MSRRQLAPKYSARELAWAKRQARLLGVETPEEILDMRWSEATRLAAQKGLTWKILPKRKPKKK